MLVLEIYFVVDACNCLLGILLLHTLKNSVEIKIRVKKTETERNAEEVRNRSGGKYPLQTPVGPQVRSSLPPPLYSTERVSRTALLAETSSTGTAKKERGGGTRSVRRYSPFSPSLLLLSLLHFLPFERKSLALVFLFFSLFFYAFLIFVIILEIFHSLENRILAQNSIFDAENELELLKKRYQTSLYQTSSFEVYFFYISFVSLLSPLPSLPSLHFNS